MAAISRNSFLLFAFLSAFQFFNFSAFSQSIPAAQAKDFIGQEKTVSGTVMKAGAVGKLFILDIDGVFPNSPFQAVIFGDKLPAFDQAALAAYKDKAVNITGKITEHKGRPQIVLNDPSQITAADGSASASPSTAPASETAPASPQPAQAPTTAPAAENNSPAPSSSDKNKKNILANGNWNKGKKGWELPAHAEVATEGDSEVLKVQLDPYTKINLVQAIEAKIPKGTKFYEISFDAKLSDGATLDDGLTVRLGQGFKESTFKKFKGFKTTWGSYTLPKTEAEVSPDNLSFTVEFGMGHGTLLIDNLQVIPLP